MCIHTAQRRISSTQRHKLFILLFRYNGSSFHNAPESQTARPFPAHFPGVFQSPAVHKNPGPYHSLQWDNNTQKAKSPVPIRVEQEDGSWLTGSSMEGDMGLEHITIYNEVDEGDAIGVPVAEEK